MKANLCYFRCHFCMRLYASVRVCTRLHASVRVCMRLYASVCVCMRLYSVSVRGAWTAPKITQVRLHAIVPK